MERKFAVIENNKVTNVVIGVEDEVIVANLNKYVEYTNGWMCPIGVDGNSFFPIPVENPLNV